MMNKSTFTFALAFGTAGVLAADPYVPATGSVWGHPGGQSNPNMASAAAIFSDPLAHGVGDSITIIVDLSNTITKDQNTKTAKTASVSDRSTRWFIRRTARTTASAFYQSRRIAHDAVEREPLVPGRRHGGQRRE